MPKRFRAALATACMAGLRHILSVFARAAAQCETPAGRGTFIGTDSADRILTSEQTVCRSPQAEATLEIPAIEVENTNKAIIPIHR